MKMRACLAFCIALPLAFCDVKAAEDIASVRVGEVSIRIPAPKGFFRYDGKQPKSDIVTKLVGEKRLLAAYSSEDDLAKVLSGASPRLERHFIVETDPKLETVMFDRELFDLLKERFRQDFSGNVEKYRETIKEVERSGSSIVRMSGRFTELKIGEMIPLGVFEETKDSSCFSFLIRIDITPLKGSEKVSGVAVSAVSMTKVRDHLVSLGCGAMYRDKADIEWARRNVQQWRDSVLAANSD